MSDIIFNNIEKFIKNYVNTILYNKKIEYRFNNRNNFIDVEISILPEKYRKYLMDAIIKEFNAYIRDIYYSDYDRYDKSICLSICLKDKIELRKEKIKDILEES